MGCGHCEVREAHFRFPLRDRKFRAILNDADEQWNPARRDPLELEMCRGNNKTLPTNKVVSYEVLLGAKFSFSKFRPPNNGLSQGVADREGFEPSNGSSPLRTFQARAFSLSATCP